MSETHPAATTLPVPGEVPYDVLVGHDLAARLPDLLGAGVERVAVVHDATLEEPLTPFLTELRHRYDVLAVGVPSGERGKTIQVAAECWESLGEAGFTRSDVVVTLGGGATTDLGGFVAATWLRGVAVVHVPTTLLGMVDAAVGGKTGINTGAGKNLVGAFHEPVGVVCDLVTLAGLPHAELVAGLAEVVKCGFVADPVILELVETHDPSGLTPDSPVLRELVERAIRVKSDVVGRDLRETQGGDGRVGREMLNYGHTLAHAIERVESYRVRHGEAVAVGCVYAAELACRAGRLDADVVERHRRVLARVGLPTSYQGAAFEDLRAAMATDKKTRGHQLRFLVLDDVARPGILAGPEEEWLREAYQALAADRPGATGAPVRVLDPSRAGGTPNSEGHDPRPDAGEEDR